MTMDHAVPVAVIGCGNFARWQHLPNLARSSLADLRLVCDANAELAASVAQRYGCASCDNSAAVWADPSIQAVVICVRDELQADLAMAALAHGKHVYVEKPLATSPSAITAVADAVQSSGLNLCVGFQKRFAPAYQMAKDLLLRQGGVRNLALRMADDAWRWAIGYEPGSLIVHDVCHLFDLARWLCASEVATIYAARSRPDDDALLLTMDNGCVVTIMASGHGSIDMPKERLDAVGDRGGVIVEDFVELRSYGIPEVNPVHYFAGVSHPDHSPLPRHLLAEQGAAGLATLRRIAWQLRQEHPAVNPHAVEDHRLAQELIPNFLRNQGWAQAMDAFLAGISSGQRSGDLAQATDAHAASVVATAALRSLESGLPERCDH